jgi:hypothetical protein
VCLTPLVKLEEAVKMTTAVTHNHAVKARFFVPDYSGQRMYPAFNIEHYFPDEPSADSIHIIVLFLHSKSKSNTFVTLSPHSFQETSLGKRNLVLVSIDFTIHIFPCSALYTTDMSHAERDLRVFCEKYWGKGETGWKEILMNETVSVPPLDDSIKLFSWGE